MAARTGSRFPRRLYTRCVFEMDNEIPVSFFELLRRLDEAALFHRVGSLREESVLVEVRSATTFWEIEFHSDGTVEYEVFKSTGTILDGRGLIELVVQWSEGPVAKASLEQPLNELAVLRLLHKAAINFTADEMLMRKIMIDGAVMIEVAVPGERWEIDILANGEIEVERFRAGEGVHDFDGKALGELLASAGRTAPNRRKGLRG